MPPADVPRPILKWAGGKAKVYPLAKAAGFIPPDYHRYWEPFAGGAAFFFAEAPATATLIDSNEELIQTYRTLQRDVQGVIHLLSAYKQLHSERFFYEMRARPPPSLSPVERAARMIYLNKTCFNGLYRVNSRGEFNVPFGRYVNPRIVDAANLQAAASLLKRAELRVGDFAEVLDGAAPGDFVYFDPPYDPLSATSNFTGYTASSFGRMDQERLRDVFADLSKRGVHCLLSNSDTPFIRELYSEFIIDSIHVGRAINSRADRRGPVGEVLVSTKRWPRKSRRVEDFGVGEAPKVQS